MMKLFFTGMLLLLFASFSDHVIAQTSINFSSLPDMTLVGGKAVKLQSFPDGLKYYDITVGTGRPAQSSDTVSLLYYETTIDKKEVDGTDMHGGKPIDFQVGVHSVIVGWDQGILGEGKIPGMKVGGKRRLVIPAVLAFGHNSPAPSIPRNATLIVDIKLIAIKKS
jgi:FKBP-type peptidyl-prolyl cis-trans isomerase